MGYVRSGTVMEPGEYAVRGGILDLFPPGRANPVRLDFFGDTLEAIKSFEVQTQRTTKAVQKLAIMPVSEVAFGEEAEKLFRCTLRGAVRRRHRRRPALRGRQRRPALSRARSTGCRCSTSTWRRCSTIVANVPVSFDHLAEEAVARRFEQIAEHYEARLEALEQQTFGAPPYKPVPPERMFFAPSTWTAGLSLHQVYRLTTFEEAAGPNVRSWRGRGGRSFAAERQQGEVNVFDAVVAHVKRLQAEHRRVIVAAWTPGARERLSTLLADHGLKDVTKVDTYADALALPARRHRARRAGAGAGIRDAGACRHRRAGHPRRPAGAPAPEAALGRRRPDRGDEFVRRRPRRARRPRHRPLCRLADDHRARRAARLPGAALRRRRQAVPAGREHRASLALRRR